MKNLLFSGAHVSGIFANFGLLLARVTLGLLMAFGHGMGKIPPSAGFIEGVAKMGFSFPVFFAWCAAGSEFLGGIFVALGLMTRISSLAVTATMASAFFISHAADALAQKEKALLFLIGFAIFTAIGGGSFSLDNVTQRK